MHISKKTQITKFSATQVSFTVPPLAYKGKSDKRKTTLCDIFI